MSYQVLARKWRPQRFDDVVGQLAVTRTLRNALASRRLAQAFVFAGPRGVGKTTTARILARALNCVNGPTPDPCGTCDACLEIAEGRDIDVLEIDAATHTQVDNVREVIITGLSIAPVRDRYKVFIIDEVHQLSSHSFNALLKSIEEPPPHVVFMMATTEIDKIPETVLSRSQVYEFRTIATKAIADQLRRIVDAEQIASGDDALQLIARDAEGSMRDAQSKLDQVIAFTGHTVTVDDVSTVLGLVGRDLLLDALQAVADEDAPAAFALVARAVEMGYDLRLVCRELARVVRDVLVITVDPSRVDDSEIAAEAERERLTALAARFSREDLLRAFDLLSRAETEVRAAAQPRYHVEMALLRWIYVRKLVSIDDLIAGAAGAGALPVARPTTPPQVDKGASRGASAPRSLAAAISAHGVASSRPSQAAPPQPTSTPESRSLVTQTSVARPDAAAAPARPPSGSSGPAPSPLPSFKDAFLAEIRKTKIVFYNMVVAQAQTIDATADRVTFTFSPAQRTLRETFEQSRSWLEATAERVAGRRVGVNAVLLDAATGTTDGQAPADPAKNKQTALREQALGDAGVQALLEVFPAEIRDIEEM